MRVYLLGCAAILITTLGGTPSSANAQNTDSFHRLAVPARSGEEKRVRRVGERMAADMLKRMQRFKAAPRDSAMVLLLRQSKYHMIVLAQCDFELHVSRQNASPAWQALSDSIAGDTRRVVIRHERLTNTEINAVLNRAARMAQFCMSARGPSF